MIELPKRLQEPDFRFVPLTKPMRGDKQSGKRAIEEGWNSGKHYHFDDPKITGHSGNIGILTGRGLVVMDCDNEIAETCARRLPRTFVVGTSMAGNYRKKHFYFRCPIEKRIVFNMGEAHLGELQALGQQVVVPPSRHFSDMRYEVIEDNEIAAVSKEDFLSAFSQLIETDIKEHSPIRLTEEQDSVCAEIKSKMSVPELMERYGFDLSKNPTRCLWHDSAGGKNFSYTNDVWYCFNCGKGGNLFHLMMEHEKVGFVAARGKFMEMLGIKSIDPDTFFNIEMNDKGEVKKKVFVSKRLGDYILSKTVIKTMGARGIVYSYRNGAYHADGEEYILGEVKNILGEDYTAHRAAETVSYIKAGTFSKREENRPNVLNIKNGLFSLTTGLLLPHTPEVFTIAQLPIEYDSSADCPAIKKFITQIVAPEDVPVVQEMIGYCLYGKYDIHKAFMLIGNGANGKSTLINLITSLLGHDNTSHISLQELTDDHFAKGRLYGKMANLFADLPSRTLADTSNFKTLTGGDWVYADIKFKEGFDFENSAKLIFSCNTLPPAYDDSDAFFRRWTFINFPNRFSGKERDTRLIEKLTTKEELSGLLNWAIAGLRGLLARGEFSNGKDIETMREMYVRMSDPVFAFMNDCIAKADPSAYVIKRDLYATYLEYCKTGRLQALDETRFAKRLLRRWDGRLADGQPNLCGKRTRVWYGIKILPLSSERLEHLEQVNPYCNVLQQNEIVAYNGEIGVLGVPPVPTDPPPYIIIQESSSTGNEGSVPNNCNNGPQAEVLLSLINQGIDISINQLKELAKSRGIAPLFVDNLLNYLKEGRRVFEPTPGTIRRI